MSKSLTQTYIFTIRAAFSKYAYGGLVVGLFALVIFLHNYTLDSVPLGLFFDESTIGLQASDLVRAGFRSDEGWAPLYFRSSSDYDSPILIYATAVVFVLLGISEYTLRLPNVLFFSMALFLSFWLVRSIFHKNKIIWVYFLIAFGLLPQTFTLSRLAFEVISQLPVVTGIFLCIWWTFHQTSSPKQLEAIKPAFVGFFIGLSVYTYSTASLLSSLLMGSILIIYFDRKDFRKFAILVGVCLITLIPYAVFCINNPGALTYRFHEISYLYSPLPLADKVGIFLRNYFSNWSPSFLILHGDNNLRHSTGVGGMIYITVFVLSILGWIRTLFEKKRNKFSLLLFINLLFTPIASALTSEGNPHAIRTLLMGYFIVLLSCQGFQYLVELPTRWIRNLLISGVFIVLGWEAYHYQFDYFIHYAAKSVDAVGGYDFLGSFEFAVEENPKEIILFDNYSGLSDSFLFYSRVVDNPNNIPIQTNTSPHPEPNVCIIYRRLSGAEEELDKYPIPYEQFNSRHRPSPIEKQSGEKTFSGVIKVRCYTAQ